MNKRQRKKRTRRCGFFHYDKELCKKLKKGYIFPWVSEQGPCPIPLCKPGDCLICRFCSDVYLDHHGPYGVVCRFGRHEGNCKSFMLDKDQPLFHPEDRKNIDAYILHIRNHNDSDKDTQGIVNIQDIFNSIDEKSFNPFDDFNDEEMVALASMGKKLMKPSFDADDLSEEEKAASTKLSQRIRDEMCKNEDESILKYLDNLFGDDKDIEQDHCGNESNIIDIDGFTTEEENK